MCYPDFETQLCLDPSIHTVERSPDGYRPLQTQEFSQESSKTTSADKVPDYLGIEHLNERYHTHIRRESQSRDQEANSKVAIWLPGGIHPSGKTQSTLSTPIFSAEGARFSNLIHLHNILPSSSPRSATYGVPFPVPFKKAFTESPTTDKISVICQVHTSQTFPSRS